MIGREKCRKLLEENESENFILINFSAIKSESRYYSYLAVTVIYEISMDLLDFQYWVYPFQHTEIKCILVILCNKGYWSSQTEREGKAQRRNKHQQIGKMELILLLE